MVTLESYLSGRRDLVDRNLDLALPQVDNDSLLHKAMRYSVFAGGKRIRPILALAAAEVVGGSHESVLPLAVALECIHTYSLIHDDLPAMDNDDLRRGKPTVHKLFGEAVAILAGDALLTFAFQVMSSPSSVRTHPPERLLAVINDLATASGFEWLVEGQYLDISHEGESVGPETVRSIMLSKTAALIRTSLICGARLAGGMDWEIQALAVYGENMGMIFQIRDDLLDIEGDPSELGKAARKDLGRGKATLPRIVGVEGAREAMRAYTTLALDALSPLGTRSSMLSEICRYISERTN